MIKRAGLSTAIFICLLLVFLCPGLVQASIGLQVLSSSAEIDFPTSLNFNLSAESEAVINDIRLHYSVDRMGHAEVSSEVYIEFTPAASVETGWAWDMRRTGGLPPGAEVEYWWTVADAAGNRTETRPERVQFNDNRYDWHSLSQGKVTLYWYEGDDSFAQGLMAVTQQALVRLAGYTGAEPDKPVRIYIYADARDLQDSMIFPQEWTGGVAFTRYGILAIGISPYNLEWGSRAIAHELTHLVIHQITFNPYGDLPVWLDEGLAMYAEGAPEAEYVNVLNNAVAEGSLISVRSLSSPFSAYAGEASLSYAQSHSLAEFLISSYGRDKMFELLNTFKQGSDYDGALLKVYGFNMDGLDTLWREYIGAETLPAQPVERGGMHPALIVLLAGIATGFLLWLGFRAWKRGSRKEIRR